MTHTSSALNDHPLDEVAWERTPHGEPAHVALPTHRAQVTPFRSRLLASAKMTEVSLISAEFGATPVVFEPWLLVLIDTVDGIEFHGIYRSAFPADPTDPPIPRFSVRTATWNAAADEEHLRDEANAFRYVTGPDHAPSITHFVSANSIAHLIGLIDELARALRQGLTMSEVERAAPGIPEHRIELFDEYAHFAWSYSRYRFLSEALEGWLSRWRTAMANQDTASALASHYRPDGAWRISYRQSFQEQLRRLSPPTLA